MEVDMLCMVWANMGKYWANSFRSRHGWTKFRCNQSHFPMPLHPPTTLIGWHYLPSDNEPSRYSMFFYALKLENICFQDPESRVSKYKPNHESTATNDMVIPWVCNWIGSSGCFADTCGVWPYLVTKLDVTWCYSLLIWWFNKHQTHSKPFLFSLVESTTQTPLWCSKSVWARDAVEPNQELIR